MRDLTDQELEDMKHELKIAKEYDDKQQESYGEQRANIALLTDAELRGKFDTEFSSEDRKMKDMIRTEIAFRWFCEADKKR